MASWRRHGGNCAGVNMARKESGSAKSGAKHEENESGGKHQRKITSSENMGSNASKREEKRKRMAKIKKA